MFYHGEMAANFSTCCRWRRGRRGTRPIQSNRWILQLSIFNHLAKISSEFVQFLCIPKKFRILYLFFMYQCVYIFSEIGAES